MSTENKVVIVTGAASGIGAAISLSFAQQHASLCVVDINEQNLHEISEKCQKLSNNGVLEVLADVTKDKDLENTVELSLKKFKRIDVLVNCAGVYIPTNLQDDDIIENFDKVISINLRGVVAMTKNALPALIGSKGCVINIASVCSSMVMEDTLVYSMTKVGVTKFTKQAAFELARQGVRVNSISPGAVRTNIMENVLSAVEAQEFWDKLADKTPMRKCVNAEEIAELAVYLASDKASSITGADFVVDAGLQLGTIGSTVQLR